MSKRISPETEMLWSAYDKGECGTVYLKNKMADMEIERDEMVKLAQELRDALETLNLVIGLTPIAGNKDALQEACDIARAAITKAKEALP